MDDSDDEAYQVATQGLRFSRGKVLPLEPVLVPFVRAEFDLENGKKTLVQTGYTHSF